MITKYELIKEYPGSPKLGYILELEKGENPSIWITKKGDNTQVILNYAMYNNTYIFPEKYPEFWKPIEDK